MKNSHRTFIVFISLIGVLCLTSALLLALAPPALSPELRAMEPADSLEAIFHTQTSIQPGHWQYIYIHQSHTAGGNALSLSQGIEGIGDHFIIGNGQGCEDGQIQMSQRWTAQKSAFPPPGARKIDPACISICLIGDFDQTVPTPAQMQRLHALVTALQNRLKLPRERIIFIDQSQAPSAAGIGRFFPVSAFREMLPQ